MSGLTDAQKARRLGKVTASTAAGLLGFSPYARPSEVWAAQMGIRPIKETLPMVMGNLYEEAIMVAAQYVMGRQNARAEKPDTCIHARHPWLLCHPDLIFWDHRELLQAKRHDAWLRDKYKAAGSESDNDRVPLHELIQCQIELACWSSQRPEGEAATWRVCWLAVELGDANGPRLYRITKDSRMIEALTAKLAGFWVKYMQPATLLEPPDDAWIGNKTEPSRVELPSGLRVKLTNDDINASPISKVGS